MFQQIILAMSIFLTQNSYGNIFGDDFPFPLVKEGPHGKLPDEDLVMEPGYLFFERYSLYSKEKVRILERNNRDVIECYVAYRTNPVLITCPEWVEIDPGLVVINQKGYVAAITTSYKHKVGEIWEFFRTDLKEYHAVEPLDKTAACFGHGLGPGFPIGGTGF